jgi:Kef-type K+ transport system membrane component KefB
METIFGLPAHALLVHIPVALIPLSALGAVVIALSERWRERIGWVVVGVAGFATIASQLAVSSGEELQEALDAEGALVERHAELAETFFWVALVFFAIVLALMVWDTLRRRRMARGEPADTGRVLGIVLSVLVIVASIGVGVRVYQVGHSGAKAVWQEDAGAFAGGEGGEAGEAGEG